MKKAKRRLGRGLELLEDRQLLTSVPHGAGPLDVSEFLLGSVAVNVVFMESNGQIDTSTEDWNDELRNEVKSNIEEGLDWWVDTLAMHSDVHELEFEVDYTHADTPFETKYEPISRNSQDFKFWIEEFFRFVDVPSSSGFTNEIRNYNHQQRVALDTNWSFTIFVVNAENDTDGLFGDDRGRTNFKRAFAYPGGQFVVMPHHRPAATIAHELAHIFWAHDEYANSDSYTESRGYYDIQNTNALDGNPDPSSREPSLMFSTGSPFTNHELSQSARETLGWRDSDGDGIFDVLDIPHLLTGVATYDQATHKVRFVGDTIVRTIENQNSSGTRHNMTLNKITDLQYRIDGGEWVDLQQYDEYQVSINETTPVIPTDAKLIEFRTIDDRIGIVSNAIRLDLPGQEPTQPILQNPENQFDVSGDGHVTAIDVLKVIIAINDGAELPSESGPPYLDVSGDSFITSRDVLMIINHINSTTQASAAALTGTNDSSVVSPTTSTTEINSRRRSTTTVIEPQTVSVAQDATATDLVFQESRRKAVTVNEPTNEITPSGSSSTGPSRATTARDAILVLLSSQIDDED